MELLRALAAGRARPPARGGRRRCRPGRPARSTGTRCPGRCRSRSRTAESTRPRRAPTAWLAELWLEVLGADVTQPGRRLLRPRRRQPHRGAAGVAAARAASPRSPSATSTSTRPSATLAAYLDAAGRRRAPAPNRHGAADAAQDPGRPGRRDRRCCGRSPGLRWLTWVGVGCRRAGRPARPGRWLPTVSWWWLLVSAGCSWSPRPAGCCSPRPAPGCSCAASRPGDYPRGGKVHLRLWLAERLADELGATNLAGAPCMTVVRPAARRRRSAATSTCTRIPPVTGMLAPRRRLLDRARGRPAAATGSTATCSTSARSASARAPASAPAACSAPAPTSARTPRSHPGRRSSATCPAGEFWSGLAGRARRAARPRALVGPAGRPAARWAVGVRRDRGRCSPCLPLAGGARRWRLARRCCWPATRRRTPPCAALLAWLPVARRWSGCVAAGPADPGRRAAARRSALQPGVHPVHSRRRRWQAWATLRVLDEARTWLFPLYSSSADARLAAALGARIGTDVEASTVLLIPTLTHGQRPGVPRRRHPDRRLRARRRLAAGRAGEDRQARVRRQLRHGRAGPQGAQGVPGRRAVGGAAPQDGARRARPGSAARRRRCGVRADDSDAGRTYDPPTPAARSPAALVEVCRARAGRWSAPRSPSWWPSSWLRCSTAARRAARRWSLAGAAARRGRRWSPRWSRSPRSGCWSGGSGRATHPLWSSFVWRNELADTFVEVVAAPWFARPSPGTPAAQRLVPARWARRIGRGVWCETYWLPETDLIELGDGATVNQGCVVQTHLFHDRVLSMDTVTLQARRDPRPEQRHPARGHARAARYGRSGVAGDARRVGAGQDRLDRQPDRPVGGRGVRLPRALATCRPPTRTSPATATASYERRRTTTSTSTTTWPATSCAARPSSTRVADEDLARLRPRPRRPRRHQGDRRRRGRRRSSPRAATGWCVTLAAPIAAGAAFRVVGQVRRRTHDR